MPWHRPLGLASTICAVHVSDVTICAPGASPLPNLDRWACLEVVDKLTKLGRRDRDTALTQLALRAQAAFQMGAGDVFAKVRGPFGSRGEKRAGLLDVVRAGREMARRNVSCPEVTRSLQNKNRH